MRGEHAEAFVKPAKLFGFESWRYDIGFGTKPIGSGRKKILNHSLNILRIRHAEQCISIFQDIHFNMGFCDHNGEPLPVRRMLAL